MRPDGDALPPPPPLTDAELPALSRSLRELSIRMVHGAKASHIGSCLSAADILAVLYGGVLRVDPARPDLPTRDRFILSKGHAAAVLYSALAERGFFPRSWLDDYCGDGAHLAGHATHVGVPGVEISTGSLGHGLSVACGMALAGTRDGAPYRVYVMLSDGECDEGSVWEAALFAPQHQLENLIAIVDYNKIQSYGSVAEVLELHPLADKWRAFRWGVREIDGHDHAAIAAALREAPFEPGRPSVVIAHTTKGRGISFMEHQLAWHYKSPTDELLRQALAELSAGA
jgi:transketolase